MLARVQKWGNSLAVRLPKNVAHECGIEAGSLVKILRKDNQIIIKPPRKELSMLESLLAEVTEDNQHAEASTGRPTGKEIW